MKKRILVLLLPAFCIALPCFAVPANPTSAQRFLSAAPILLDTPYLAQLASRAKLQRRGNWTSGGGRRTVPRVVKPAAKPTRRKRASYRKSRKRGRRKVKPDVKNHPTVKNTPITKPAALSRQAVPSDMSSRAPHATPAQERLVVLRQRLQPPPTLPGMPPPVTSLSTPSGMLPQRARAGSSLPLQLHVNGAPFSLGRIQPRGNVTEIVGQIPSGLLWLRAHASGEVTWDVTVQFPHKGKKKMGARFRGRELARRVPPGDYTIRAQAEKGGSIEVGCRITMEDPVCQRDLDLR